MWELIEYGAWAVALFCFVNILFHNPIRTTEEWDKDEESDKENEE